MDYGSATLQAIACSMGAFGQRPALHEFRKGEAKVWSFAELDILSRQLAAGLLDAGFHSGSRAILFAPNRAEWIIACLALLRAGIVPVPMDAQAGPAELNAVAEQCNARLVLTSKDLAERAVAPGDSPRKYRLLLLESDRADSRGWQNFLLGKTIDPPAVRAEDPAVLFYTSGTSGTPKGVPLTHRNIASNLSALLGLGLMRETDRVLLPLPLHHVYPFSVGMLAPLAYGVPVILPYLLTGPHLQAALHDGRATALIGVPRLYEALLAAVEARMERGTRLLPVVFRGTLALAATTRRRLGVNVIRPLFAPLRRRIAPELRLLACGGAAIGAELAQNLEALGWQLVTGYGLTETAPILTFDVPGRHRAGAAGKPLPGVEIKIAPPDRHAAHGEIRVKGPNVFSGYFDPRGKGGEVFDEEGYFRTGDLGFFDGDGYLHLVGRASSMIVLSHGENIWPEKIEQALEQSGAIAEAAVFARGDRLAAIVVPEASEESDRRRPLAREEIEGPLRGLPSHHHLAEWVEVSEPLPRTRIGKLQRHKLPELFEQAKRGEARPSAPLRPLKVSELSPEVQTLLQDPAARAVWDWLTQRFRDMPMAPTVSLQRDLGIDSMGWLNLTLEIRERAGVDLDETIVGRIHTVGDLLRETAQASPDHNGAISRDRWIERPHDLLSDRQRKWLGSRGAAGNLLGHALLEINRLSMRWLYRLDVRGRNHLPQEGPFILTPNHASLLDPLALGAALPPAQLRRTYWGGWTGIMFKNPLMRFASASLRVIPVDPERGSLSALAFGLAALREGNNLVWFPEGGRSPEGKIQGFRPGIGVLLSTGSFPAVPVYIHGTFSALPYGRRWPRRSKITVTFGEPFQVNPGAGEGASESSGQGIADALHARVKNLERAFHPQTMKERS